MVALARPHWSSAPGSSAATSSRPTGRWRRCWRVAAAAALVAVLRPRVRCRRRGPGRRARVLRWPSIVGAWSHSLDKVDAQNTAEAIRARYGGGPYAFMGNEDLPLCFHMGSVIPVVRKPDQLLRTGRRASRGSCVIEALGDDRRPPSPVVARAHEVRGRQHALPRGRAGHASAGPAAGAGAARGEARRFRLKT